MNSDHVFKVMTMNLRKDSTLDRKNRWTYRKQMVTSFIRESEADIIGVQELMPKMKEDIKQYLPEYSIFGDGRCKGFFNEHVDILSNNQKVSVLDSRTIWLSKKPDKIGTRGFLAVFPRICTICEAELKGSHQRIRVFNAHFDHISWYARKIGLETILKQMDMLQQKQSLPMIFMGDFNIRPGNKLIQRLSNHYHPYQSVRLVNAYASVNQHEQSLPTYHGFQGHNTGKNHLDYIFVSDDLEIVDSYIDQTSKEGRYLSDHYPVITTLKMRS